MMRRGVTLMELVVVLAVLTMLGALLVPVLFPTIQTSKDGPAKTPERVVTEATMNRLRQTIVGTRDHRGYWNDLLPSQSDTTPWPWTMTDLFIPPTYLPTNLQSFDPTIRRGWHGPYLLQETGRYPISGSNGFTFNSAFVLGGSNIQASGTGGGGYGLANDPAIIDGWGHPIVIQWPSNTADTTLSLAAQQAQFVRLVSAGPNGVIDTPLTDTPNTDATGALTGDDVILYLRYVPSGSYP